ncbi:MAG: hypothetical protein PHD95_00790 [Candidatus ainarchaeum sp.]|nr:hypothetical protein [Candidatus ainarchaeum sp.]
MVEKERQLSYSWYLDKEKKNQVFIRFVFTSDGKNLEEFSVSYCLIIGEKPKEIVRYDCSAREEVHVHQFFYNHHEKKKLNKKMSYDTMQEFVGNIEKNWRQYLAKFKEK